MKTIFVFLLFQSFYVYMETADIDMSKLHAFFIPCKAKDPNLNECVKAAGQQLIPKVAHGIKEWDVPSVDPMETPEITFTQNKGGNDLKITYKNVIQTGYSQIQIESADIDLQHGVMTFKLKYPYITFTADYTSVGQFLGFNVNGNGKANISVWNAYSSFVLKFHVERDYIKQDSVIIGFSFDKIFLDYTNLILNDDPALSKSAVKFINDNSVEVIQDFKPELEKFYSDISSKFLQALFDVVPYSILFPME